MRLQVLILAAMLISNLSWAADKPSGSVMIRDAKEYIDTIEKASKVKMEDQIDIWQTFLSDHPKQTFRKEIEKNIELLQSLSQKKSNGKQGDERDADLYLKALEFSKRLSLQDQIQMWQQFLDENPTSIYRNEAQTRLYRLKRVKSPTPVAPTQPPLLQPTAPPPSSQIQPTYPVPLTTSVGGVKPKKDRDKALLLASIAGLVVPGMGHWYTEDYVIAGVLSTFRVAGLAIGIPGIINSNYNQIYVGGGLTVLSYVIDIADAPYSADRLNDKQSQSYLLPEQNGQAIPVFAYSFSF